MYLSTSTSTEDFPEMYLSTFQVLYKLYLSTDVLKYKVLLPGSGCHDIATIEWFMILHLTSCLVHRQLLPQYTVVAYDIAEQLRLWECHRNVIECIR